MRRVQSGARRVLIVVSVAAVALAQPALDGAAVARGPSAMTGRGMWIWYVSRSAGGDPAAIAAQARASGVATLYVKSADGATAWSQFSPALVAALHAAGLRVCAWQYVYGADPLGEAAQGARAARDGADCLVIDAEAEYEGRYAAAQAYLRSLRGAVGRGYPVGLASFPYVDYHPAFPYSVFLGRGGAQYDMPQMYWRDIGVGVGQVFRHTYTYNRIYRRTILPVGQVYGGPSAGDVQAFRALTVRYRAPGISWWDFAWASASALWPALGGSFGPALSASASGYPALGAGAQGDDVLWLQERLAGLYPDQRLTGRFAGQTRAHLAAFQAAHGLAATGVTDAATWRRLLHVVPVDVIWTASRAGTASARQSPDRPAGAPLSAGLAASTYEVLELGASHPSGRPGPGDPAATRAGPRPS